MKILGIHADVCQLGGHTRMFLMAMDIFKALGHEVHIVTRTSEESEKEVNLPFVDPTKAKPLFFPVKVKAIMNLSHHPVERILDYQPLRQVVPGDITAHDIPVVYWGDHFLTPWAPEVVEMIGQSDLVFCDTEMYVRMESDLNIAEKHIQFVHFPTQNIMPVSGKEPRYIWANSIFTQGWIRHRWGFSNPNYSKQGDGRTVVNIPNQIYSADIVYPPIYTEDYRNDSGFKDRNFDVVMFARLGEDKFTVADYLNEHFKLLTMGAKSPIPPSLKNLKRYPNAKQVDFNPPKTQAELSFTPKGKLRQNVPFGQIRHFLSKAKVYVHSKGFGTMPVSGGISQPEHFGITICEAMAAGCPVIVPRSGGCWTDISGLGSFTLAYSSLEELNSHIKLLISNEKEWTKWHDLALKRVEAFDFEVIKNRVKELLNCQQ